MAKDQRFFGMSRRSAGTRPGLRGNPAARAHIRELGVAKSPVVPAMDQPLVEPRSAASGRMMQTIRSRWTGADGSP